jgi:integrase
VSIKEEVEGKQYLVVVWGNLRPDGTRPRMVRRVYGGRRAAAAKERELLTKRDEGRDFTAQTVAQYAAKFLAGKRREGAKENTIRHYSQSFNSYLIPRLGSKPIAKLTTGRLRTFFEDLEFGGMDGAKLSGTMRNGIERDCKALFRRAYDDQVVKRDIGKTIKKTPVDGTEPVALSPDEGRAFLTHLEGSSVHLPAVTMYCTGMRPEEMRGLIRSNLSLDGPEPFIHVMGTKTERSDRYVPISVGLADLLRDELKRLDAAAERMGPHWQDEELVFPTLLCSSSDYLAGRPWTPNAFGHAWVKARGPKWSHVKPYTMRHTYITQRLAEGVRLEVVSRLVGHSTSGFTAAHYSHVLPGELHGVVVQPPRQKGE